VFQLRTNTKKYNIIYFNNAHKFVTFAAHSPHCAGLLTAAVQMVSHFFGPCCVFICLCAAASFGFCRLTERIIKIGTYFWSQCGVVGPAFVVVIVTVAAAVRISLLHMCVYLYLYLVQFGSFIFAIFRILLNAGIWPTAGSFSVRGRANKLRVTGNWELKTGNERPWHRIYDLQRRSCWHATLWGPRFWSGFGCAYGHGHGFRFRFRIRLTSFRCSGFLRRVLSGAWA